MTSKGQGQVSASTISSGVPPGECSHQDSCLCSAEQHSFWRGLCLSCLVCWLVGWLMFGWFVIDCLVVGWLVGG